MKKYDDPNDRVWGWYVLIVLLVLFSISYCNPAQASGDLIETTNAFLVTAFFTAVYYGAIAFAVGLGFALGVCLGVFLADLVFDKTN